MPYADAIRDKRLAACFACALQVVRSRGRHTAWADKHPAYDLLNGPSGNGVEQLYTPEINSKYQDGDYTSQPKYTMVYDKFHVDAAVNWTRGQTKFNAVPDLYGFNFQVKRPLALSDPWHVANNIRQRTSSKQVQVLLKSTPQLRIAFGYR